MIKMKKIKTIIISAVFLLSGMTLFAQGGGMMNFQYDMGFGLGNTKDFVDAPSFRGFSLEGRGFVSEHLTIGGRWGWQTFYKDMGKVTRTNDTYTITGYNKRYINAMPLMATVHYYFTTSKVYSYIGLGIGTYYLNIRDQMGIYYVPNNTWRFGLSPDVGVVIPLGHSIGATANFRYNYAAKTKDKPTESWIGIGVGLTYTF
jgi:hypothetical protein